MAGIGFELKKLFNKKGYISNISAYFFSTLITVGPMLICICMILFSKIYLNFIGETNQQFELLMATMVYCFIFSMILTGGFVFILSRYISDCLFTRRTEKILPSFYGAIVIVTLLSGIIGIVFLRNSPLSMGYKLIAYLLFVELSILWVQTVYLSTLKDYARILRGFLVAAAITMLFSVLLTQFTSYSSISCILLSLTISFAYMNLSFGVFIRGFYPEFEAGMFEFVEYFKKYTSLFLIGLFMTGAVYVHNFIFWASEDGVLTGGTFISCPTYDIPVFFSILTIIPAMVIFVVTVETNFYNKYRLYYSAILNGGTISEIKLAKTEMIDVLRHEIAYIMEVQLFASFISIALGMKLLPRIGFTETAINLFSMLTLGSFVYVIMYILVLLMLYFDDKKGALLASCTFLVCNLVFTLISLELGSNYYGTGYFAAGFVALLVGLGRFSYFINSIDYYTFCKQPLITKVEDSKFSKLVDSVSKRI